MLELKHLTKRFAGIPAVDDVSFQAHPGVVTGYLGPNGSGKSTTMKMITGLMEPTSGAEFFNGVVDCSDLLAFKRRLGYVPEEPHLYTHLTGFEYLEMVAQLRDLPERTTRRRIEDFSGSCRLRMTVTRHLRIFQRHAPEGAVGSGVAA